MVHRRELWERVWGLCPLSNCSIRAGTYFMQKGICKGLGRRLTKSDVSLGFRKVPEVLREHFEEMAKMHGPYCVLEAHIDTASDPSIRMTGECVDQCDL